MSNIKNLAIHQKTELPSNIEAEQTLIGSILENNEMFDEISDVVTTDHFYDDINKKIYSVISNLISKGLLANPITLKNFFNKEEQLQEIGGSEYLVKLTKVSTTKTQIKFYVNLLSDLLIRRKLISISKETFQESSDKNIDKDANKILEDTEKKLFDIAENGNFNRKFISFQEALQETVSMASAAFKNEKGIVGVPTGLTELDNRLGGLHKQDLIIIAGRPSMGKTALATNIAFNAAKDILENEKKSAVAFFSLEMSSEQLSTRILAEQSRIRSNNIRTGKINQDDFDKFIEASRDLENLPLHIDDTPAIPIATLSNSSRNFRNYSRFEGFSKRIRCPSFGFITIISSS